MKKLFSLSLVAVLSLGLLVGFAGNAGAQDVDVVTAASITDNPAALEKAMGEDGTWIICPTTDMRFNSELVIEGTFDKDRKVGAYKSNDAHKLVERYTLAAPQFTVKSPNTLFKGGYFVGDVVVESKGFTLEDGFILGNLYFANEEIKSSFTKKAGAKVYGETKVMSSDVDVVSSASITNDPAAAEKAMGEDGTWIIAPTTDMRFNSELLIEGTFDQGRKLGAYKSNDAHKLVDRYTVYAPQFTVESPNTLFKGGYFVGNVVVKAKGFTLEDGFIAGDLYFENEEYKSDFTKKAGAEVLGEIKVLN